MNGYMDVARLANFKGYTDKDFKGDIKQNADLAVGEAIKRFQKKQNTDNAGTVIRPLTPMDFTTASTQKSWAFTGFTSSGNTANTIVNISVPDDKYLVVYGVSLPNASTVTEIDISRSGSTARFWNVEWGAQQTAEGGVIFFDNPFIVESNQNLTVTGYASSTGTFTVVFLGSVVEERGLNVGC